MARPWETDPDFGTREEDWPDPDVDSDTSEGREIMERGEAALAAMIERPIQQREEARRARAAAYGIPEALYDKARDHQDQLTQEERKSLLTKRGGIVGKALAHPDSLTEEEMHQALLWPTPDKVRADLEQANGGTPITPVEVYARGKEALARGQKLADVLSAELILLIARNFDPKEETKGFCKYYAYQEAGVKQAAELVRARLGLDTEVLQAAHKFWIDLMIPRPAPLDNTPRQFEPWQSRQQEPVDVGWAIAALDQKRQLGTISDEEAATCSREYLAALQDFSRARRLPLSNSRHLGWPNPNPAWQTDRYVSTPWPPTAQPCSPMGLMADEMDLWGWYVEPGWQTIPEAQRQSYRDRCEQLRLDAWAENERQIATGMQQVAPLPPVERQPSRRQSYSERTLERGGPFVRRGENRFNPKLLLTGLMLFREELEDLEGLEYAEPGEGPGSQFQEVLRRWDDMTREQQERYEARAIAEMKAPTRPVRPYIITGFELFDQELGIGFSDALQKWEDMTDEEIEPYQQRAKEQNEAAQAAWRAARKAWTESQGVAATAAAPNHQPSPFSHIQTQTNTFVTGFKLFRDDLWLKESEAWERWKQMTDEEMQPYKQRAEEHNNVVLAARRPARTAWTESQGAAATATATAAVPSQHQLSPFSRIQTPTSIAVVTGFQLFREELRLEFPEAMARWGDMTDEQIEPYEQRAKEQNEATLAARRAARGR